jgi:hypothetical protein
MVAATRLTATLFLALLFTAAAWSKMRPVLSVEGHPLSPGAEALPLHGIIWASLIRLREEGGGIHIDPSLEHAAPRAPS